MTKRERNTEHHDKHTAETDGANVIKNTKGATDSDKLPDGTDKVDMDKLAAGETTDNGTPNPEDNANVVNEKASTMDGGKKLSYAETDPEKALKNAPRGAATSEDGIHHVVETKSNPRSSVAPVTGVRRNIDNFVTEYSGQIYECLARNSEGKEVVVGYTNDGSGGGMIELVDASPDLRGPVIVRLEKEDMQRLTNEAYAAKTATKASTKAKAGKTA